eukprot:SAG11_NODE_9127_length_940_cov_0.965517_2_plen_159_part_00
MVDYTGIDGPTKPIGLYLESYLVPDDTDLAVFYGIVGAHLDALQDVVRKQNDMGWALHECRLKANLRKPVQAALTKSPRPPPTAPSPSKRHSIRPLGLLPRPEASGTMFDYSGTSLWDTEASITFADLEFVTQNNFKMKEVPPIVIRLGDDSTYTAKY